MASRLFSRRQFLATSLRSVGGLGLAVAGIDLARQGVDLREQKKTWAEASRSNESFFQRHSYDLNRLTLGASFAPEQWSTRPEGHGEAMRGLQTVIQDLNLKQIRLGLRWNRSLNAADQIDLRAYDPFLDYCLSHGAEVCLNVGPIKTFRWPEEHPPRNVISGLERIPPAETSIYPWEPLGAQALDYLAGLMPQLQSTYGNAFSSIQVENEPYFAFGIHKWRLSQSYMVQAASTILEAFPEARLLVTSSGRLNLGSIKDLFLALMARDRSLAGRLVSGFDYYYKSPVRDSESILRHFDPISYARPFATSCEGHVDDSRAIGFSIEVTEGQAEPYGKFTTPGNSVKDLRYLILRCLDKVVDPRQPALIRLWGVEELAKRMQRGALTDEHRQMIEVIQVVNQMQPGAAYAGASP
jgi:hypothetical protein